jgi:disulfide bond formation protein DsbB
LAIAVSGAFGLYHAGVELHLLPGLTTCSAASSGLSGEDLLKSILNTPLVRCDQVQWSFLGVSMAGWNAIISLGGAVAIAFLLVREKRG